MPSYCMTADKEEEKISRNKQKKRSFERGGGREGERKRDSKIKRMRTKKRGKEGKTEDTCRE